MPYTVPNVFVGGTPIAAAALQTNNDGLRDYIDRGIVAGDIAAASVTTVDVVRGEFYGVTNDHQFTTGDLYTQNVSVDTFDTVYFTSHINAWNQLATDKFMEVPSAGKRIVLEEEAQVLVTLGINFIGDENYELFAGRRASFLYLRHTQGDVVENSDVLAQTAGFSFTEDSYVDDFDSSGVTSDVDTWTAAARRWYCTRFLFTSLPAGVHHFVPVVNPRSDKSHIAARVTNIEVFYR
jgi:hypothetical protein